MFTHVTTTAHLVHVSNAHVTTDLHAFTSHVTTHYYVHTSLVLVFKLDMVMDEAMCWICAV